jgi:hypothetical protein
MHPLQWANESRIVPRFEKWNYADMEELARMKLGIVAKGSIFLKITTDNFESYYQDLIHALTRYERKSLRWINCGRRRSRALP